MALNINNNQPGQPSQPVKGAKEIEMIKKSMKYKNGIKIDAAEIMPKYGSWGEAMMLSYQNDVEQGKRTQEEANRCAEKLVSYYIPSEAN